MFKDYIFKQYNISSVNNIINYNIVIVTSRFNMRCGEEVRLQTASEGGLLSFSSPFSSSVDESEYYSIYRLDIARLL